MARITVLILLIAFMTINQGMLDILVSDGNPNTNQHSLAEASVQEKNRQLKSKNLLAQIKERRNLYEDLRVEIQHLEEMRRFDEVAIQQLEEEMSMVNKEVQMNHAYEKNMMILGEDLKAEENQRLKEMWSSNKEKHIQHLHEMIFNEKLREGFQHIKEIKSFDEELFRKIQHLEEMKIDKELRGKIPHLKEIKSFDEELIREIQNLEKKMESFDEELRGETQHLKRSDDDIEIPKI